MKSRICGVGGAIALLTPILFSLGWLTFIFWLLALAFFANAHSFREQEKAAALRNSYINGRYHQ